MILGTEAILVALRDGAIVCDPAPARIEGAHIDVRLGPHYWRWAVDPEIRTLDIGRADPARCFDLIDAGAVSEVIVPPRGFVLAHTIEAIGTAPASGLVPMLHTRSTLARWGLSVCTANAGQGDEGYMGVWTLEIVNPHPVAIALPVGARVGSIAFHRVEGAATPYEPGTRYNATRAEWSPDAMLPRPGNW